MTRKRSVSPETISVDDIDAAIELYKVQFGYRLDMIVPADAPREALLSKDGEVLRLLSERPQLECGPNPEIKSPAETSNVESIRSSRHPAHAGGSDFVRGRTGMEYRDLIPGRLDGNVIASHIRIPDGGEVADYVHYHKVRFQLIYCVAGSIRVVYEDQGPPFWLKPGDCVLQPPQIRHRVLEAEANSEVVEISSPAVHETWVDHDLKLPTEQIRPARDFSGQRFIHHIAAEAEWTKSEFDGFEVRHTGIAAASDNAVSVFELRTQDDHSTFQSDGRSAANIFYFVVAGRLTAASGNFGERKFTLGDSLLIPPRTDYRLDAAANSAILCAVIQESAVD